MLPWTDKELSILKEQYASVGANIPSLINRSNRAIQVKGRRLGLSVSRNAKKRIYWHKLSDISKKKISNGLKTYYRLFGSHRKGKKFSKASKRKLSNAMKGLLVGTRNGMFGKSSPYLSGGIKWHIYNSKQHGAIKLHGTYELEFATFLDSINIKWYMQGQFPRWKYICNGINKTYSPDFYVPSWEMYIDTKGFFSEKDQEKIRLVREYNTDKYLIIASKDIMKLFYQLKTKGDN